MAGENDPIGAHLVDGGATFRIWAPEARNVSVGGSFNQWNKLALNLQADGYWWTFVQGAKEGDQYKFEIEGVGSAGAKRDPRGRSRTWDPPFPACNNFITQPATFPWHDAGFQPPPFHQLIIYQLHVGAFVATDGNGVDVRRQRPGRFLDVLAKLEYLTDLGVTAVQFLPIQEFETTRSLGYNGTDLFAPELDYALPPGSPEFQRYLDLANALLATKGFAPFQPGELDCQTKQLMAMVDLFHVYGIAVIFDLVYNHAGGDFGAESVYFLDRQPEGDNSRSLYFTNAGWAGGLVFAYWQEPVRQFLIDNAVFFFNDYHVDGFRFDEVTVIDKNGGWNFLQDLTDTLHHRKPNAAMIAEYWADQSAVLRGSDQGGAGFDAVVDSGLRETVRGVLRQAAQGRDAAIGLDGVARELLPKYGQAWRSVHHLENHDVVRVNNESDREPRIAAVGDGSDARSWHARSRARWANGLLLTAPGAPMLFMGQEFLEDKYWSDSPDFYGDYLIWWDGLDRDRTMQDHLRFIRELIGLRRSEQALTSDAINVFHVHNDNRVLAFHRWVPGTGNDVVLAFNLREEPWFGYELGLPKAGTWREIFNSDVYDGWVNAGATGNGGSLYASDRPMHGLNASAAINLPANGFIVLSCTA
ncbi:alpha-amylase family glycosyl hydrolase [Mesorhizobium sp. M0166]|uniref:alpha amylase C-terminal domain-containing protein n=1 Tax=Mesorhizobium sp. M0166 TaxID=2956902 RepID=UPI003336E59E